MPKDVLEDIVAQLRAAVPDYPQDRLYATAAKIRQDWGGTSAYIKKAPAEGKALTLGHALASGASLGDAFLAAGCRPAWGYRLLRRRR